MAQLPTPSASTPAEPLVTPVEIDITDPESVLDRLREAASDLGGDIVEQLPLVVLGLVVFGLGLVVVRIVYELVVRSTAGARWDTSVARLIQTLTRVGLVFIVLLLAMSVAGVNIGAALAALGIAGIAVALALQSILADFIAGILLLGRRPFRPGDQVELGDHEGVVEDIDLRVTRLVDFDGELVLLPNAQVFENPIVNRTHGGRRRTTVMVGVDYRDDHDAARDVILDAVRGLEDVLDDPAPHVQLTELGDSSVDFAVRYWTLPEQAVVLRVRDLVLAAVKTALADAGMTIPWPIRTLVVDPDSTGPLRAAVRVTDGDRPRGAGPPTS